MTTTIQSPSIGDRLRALATGGRCPAGGDRLQLCAGTMTDYARLAPFHYRTGPPATHVKILTLRDPHDGTPVGVLVVSMPTLNGAWREAAWPGDYAECAIPAATRAERLREITRRVNRDLRCISRVIIDPRWRGLGLAKRLVRAYLEAPLTPRTEAIAAMGEASPFFARAGMRPVRIPRPASHWRLLDALAHARLAPIDLIDPPRRTRAMRAHPWLTGEIAKWTHAHPGPRRLAADASAIAAIAGATLLAAPIAYIHGRAPACDPTQEAS